MSQDCTRNSPMSASYREQYPDFGSDTKKLEALRQIRAREVWQYENSGRRREYPQEELEELDYNIQRLEAHIAEAQAAWPNVGTPAFKYEEKPPTLPTPATQYVPYPGHEKHAGMMAALSKREAELGVQLAHGWHYAEGRLEALTKEKQELQAKVHLRRHAWMIGGPAGYAGNKRSLTARKYLDEIPPEHMHVQRGVWNYMVAPQWAHNRLYHQAHHPSNSTYS